VVTGLALRYFYVAHEWRRSVGAGAPPRHAGARRLAGAHPPHFLFNSMNTIAALTRQQPLTRRAGVQDWRICSAPP